MFLSECLLLNMIKMLNRQVGYLILIIALVACSAKSGKDSGTQDVAPVSVEVPVFDADSAYAYVERQVEFGYRVPNTPAHQATADYLAAELKRHGAAVEVQEGTVTAYDGTELSIRNIIGSFSPEKKNRILLFAHWDTRPYADNDADKSKHRMPIAGADDGASGVGVLLEIARQVGQKLPDAGVDIAFFDAEDYGAPYWAQTSDEDTWALGTQYWTRRPHKPGYRARFGILLDMVGGTGAKFRREMFSEYYASGIVKQVWETARRLGYGSYFVDEKGGYVTDDHVYVNRYGIPSVDIIACSRETVTGFPPYWHTVDDTMKNIDPATLKAVGQTVLTVIYEE